MKRSELHSAVWAHPISAVAQQCGLSDTWLRKVCRTYNVPVPPRGYWQKVHAGHRVQALALPEGDDVDIELTARLEAAAHIVTCSAEATPNLPTSPQRTSVGDRKPGSPSVDLTLDLVLLERDAQNLLRHRAMEGLLADLTAALSVAPHLAPDEWREWMFRMRAELQQRSPSRDLVECAMKRFSVEKHRSR